MYVCLYVNQGGADHNGCRTFNRARTHLLMNSDYEQKLDQSLPTRLLLCGRWDAPTPTSTQHGGRHLSSFYECVCRQRPDEFGCIHRLKPVHLTHCQLPFFLKWLMFSCSSVSCATLLYRKAAFLVHRRQPSSRQFRRNRLPIQMNQRTTDSSLTWHLYRRFLNVLSWSRSLSTLKKPTWYRNFSRPTANSIVPSLHLWRFCQTFSMWLYDQYQDIR